MRTWSHQKPLPLQSGGHHSPYKGKSIAFVTQNQMENRQTGAGTCQHALRPYLCLGLVIFLLHTYH